MLDRGSIPRTSASLEKRQERAGVKGSRERRLEDGTGGLCRGLQDDARKETVVMKIDVRVREMKWVFWREKERRLVGSHGN